MNTMKYQSIQCYQFNDVRMDGIRECEYWLKKNFFCLKVEHSQHSLFSGVKRNE